MTKTEIRCVKRLFKELGIYNVWIKNRKKQLTHKENFWALPSTFCNLIDRSFIWSLTNENKLWDELYNNIISYD